MIGGYLAQPASKFGPLKKPFFCKYPYSLPCIVGGTLAIVSFIGNQKNFFNKINVLLEFLTVYSGRVCFRPKDFKPYTYFKIKDNCSLKVHNIYLIFLL